MRATQCSQLRGHSGSVSTRRKEMGTFPFPLRKTTASFSRDDQLEIAANAAMMKL